MTNGAYKRQRWKCWKCERRCVLKTNSVGVKPPDACTALHKGKANWRLIATGSEFSTPSHSRGTRR